ncbi:uncharacterized protein LOC131620221 [Vicia villosa]|uniref:uncharacterized protein LOC131620221 n=1 Tax=Vicia villosa TaxID=3911 RepID=UPI00273BC479|nr:uncharacterized protein LOC131620221 [Vicia villosa]
MNVIKTISHAPTPPSGTTDRRDPVLAEFEEFFRSEIPEVKTQYLNSLNTGDPKEAPKKVQRKRPSTSSTVVSEEASDHTQTVAVNKEKRTKRKFDPSSDNQEKVKAATVATVNVAEQEAVVEADPVPVQAAEEEEVEEEEEAQNQPEVSSQRPTTQTVEGQKTAECEKENPESARRREISLGKSVVVEMPKRKKQRKLEAVTVALQKVSKVYGDDVEMEDADAEAEDHSVEEIPVEENPSHDLSQKTAMEAMVINADPLNRSCEASSGEPSVLARTLEVIQKTQVEMASRMHMQDETNAEFRTFIQSQNESNAGIQAMLAKIMIKDIFQSSTLEAKPWGNAIL